MISRLLKTCGVIVGLRKKDSDKTSKVFATRPSNKPAKQTYASFISKLATAKNTASTHKNNTFDLAFCTPSTEPITITTRNI